MCLVTSLSFIIQIGVLVNQTRSINNGNLWDTHYNSLLVPISVMVKHTRSTNDLKSVMYNFMG